MAFAEYTGIDFAYNDGLQFDNAVIFPRECAFSRGSTVATDSRFSYDYSKTSQSITRRRYPMAPTYTINFSYNRVNTTDIVGAIYRLEDAVKRTGELYYNGEGLGLVVVKSVTFTPHFDSQGDVYSCDVTVNLLAARVPMPRANVAIRT